MSIYVLKGDITACDYDAIVNAANENLLAGGGVCGAIHAAAGPALEEHCRTLGRINTSDAVITPGFGLKAKYVIHAVGPRWQGGEEGEAAQLERCYKNILALSSKNNIQSLAVPAISTGIFGYPLKEATTIAVDTALSWLEHEGHHCEITFVCFDDRAQQTYLRALQQKRAL